MASKKDKDNSRNPADEGCKATCDAGLREDAKDEGRDLIDEACEAYGINKRYVFSSAYHSDTDEAVIVTNGGAKVRYRRGDKVEALPPVRVDGIIRKKMRVVAGKGK